MRLIQSTTQIFTTLKDFYFSKTENEDKLLQVMQSENALKAWTSVKMQMI